MISRRKAVERMSVGALSPLCPAGSTTSFSPEEKALVEVMAELLIPQTETPGARAAGVPEFIERFVASCDGAYRSEFRAGAAAVNQLARRRFRKPFPEATTEQQIELLREMAGAANKKLQRHQDFFALMRRLTVVGYYTSEAGLKQELGFAGIPIYKGCTHGGHSGDGQG
jgi:gluconate 2-dehydrogenase gamma chain